MGAALLAWRAEHGPPVWAVGMGVASLAFTIIVITRGSLGSEPVLWAVPDPSHQEIYVVNMDGSGLPKLTNRPTYYHDLTWSPDGRQIVFGASGPEDPGIFVIDADGRDWHSLAQGSMWYGVPTWSPDGATIAYYTHDEDYNNSAICAMNPDGSRDTELVRLPAGFVDKLVWSPDGVKIAFTSYQDTNGIYVINADGSAQVNLTANLEFADSPTWSPDGRKIAFSAFGTSGPDVYTVNSDGTELVNLTSNGDGLDPAWSPDGTRIAFRSFSYGVQISVVNPDGTGQIILTGQSKYDMLGDITWSVEGSKIAFWAYPPQGRYPDIYVMNADGSALTRLVTVIVEQPDISRPDVKLPPFWQNWRLLLPWNWGSLFVRSLGYSRNYIPPSGFAWSPDSGKIAFVSMPEAPELARARASLMGFVSFVTFFFFGLCGPAAVVYGIKSRRRHGRSPGATVCIISGGIPSAIIILLSVAVLCEWFAGQL